MPEIDVEMRYTEGHHQTAQDEALANRLRETIEALLRSTGAPGGRYRARILRRMRPGTCSSGIDRLAINSQKHITARVMLGANSDTCREIRITPPEGCLETAFRCLSWRERPPDEMADLTYSGGIHVLEVFELVLRALTMSGATSPHKLHIATSPPKELRYETGTLTLLDSGDNNIVAIADPKWGRAYSIIIDCNDPRRTWEKLVDSKYAVPELTAFRVSPRKQSEVDMLAVALLLVEKLAERGEMPLTDEGSAKSAFSEIEMEYGLDWPTVRRKVFASVRDGRIYPKDWVLIKIAEALGQPDTPEFFPVLIQGIYECDHSVKSCLQSGVSEDPEHCRLQDKLVALTNRADELRAALDAVELEIAGNKRTAHEIRVRQGVRRSELALLQSVVNRRGYQAVRKAIEKL